MDGERFDDVKHEKAKAMARFRRFQMIKKMWKVLVVVVLLSWTSKNFPAVVKFSGECLFPVPGYVLNPHVAFLIGNAIIFVLLLLCGKKGPENVPGGGDLYDEYARHSVSNQPVGSDRESELKEEEKKEMIVAENDGGCGGCGPEAEAEEKEMQIVVAEDEQCEAVKTAVAKAAKQIRRFERTQSEKLRQEIAVRPRRRELRRSETEMRLRRTIIKPAGETATVTSSFDTVESLSSEEFKLAIEAFIDKHREMFYVQKMQELKQLKSN